MTAARPRERMIRNVRLLFLDAPEALVEDGVRPPGTHDTGVRDPDQQAAYGRWIQDAGIVDDDECHRAQKSKSCSCSSAAS